MRQAVSGRPRPRKSRQLGDARLSPGHLFELDRESRTQLLNLFVRQCSVPLALRQSGQVRYEEHADMQNVMPSLFRVGWLRELLVDGHVRLPH